MEELVSLVKSGKFKAIMVDVEGLFNPYGDNDVEAGILIDPAFLLTFHKHMAAAKHPVVWQHGPFFVVVDCELPERMA
jgi:hypothetical protein